MSTPYSKYSGCGNDFIIIDNRKKVFDEGNRTEIKRLCHRRLGIGADGVILLEKSTTADFRMRIFNADGSEAEMCGNGVRCLVKFIRELGLNDQQYSVETISQMVEASLDGDLVSVKMPQPFDIQYFTTISINETPLTVHYLNTGVPHVVIFVRDIEDDSLMKIASSVRHHPSFSPKGANVNFVAVSKGNGTISDHTIYVRTYERGVEGETLACGTGAAASAIAAAHVHGLQCPITVSPKSKDLLHITFTGSHHSPENLILSGPAVKICDGFL